MLRKPRPSNAITAFSGDVTSKYSVDKKVLGEGHYGTVRKCLDKATKQWYALKTIKKAKVRRAGKVVPPSDALNNYYLLTTVASSSLK